MRILKFLMSSFLVIGVLVIGVFLIGREILLLWGTSSVRSSLTELQSISRNATEYVRLCRQKGTPEDQVAIARLQLRFLSDTEYVSEVLCNQFLLDPIVIRSQKLPLLVNKVAGSSGILWGTDRSGIALEVLGRKRSVIVDNKQIIGAPGNAALGFSPESSCQGYGYQCCQAETTSGVGSSYAQVNDCPKSCFSACVPRPVILSFTTDPFADAQTRTVSITSGENVTFSYVASYDADKKVTPTIRIDYGDGQTDQKANLSGIFEHQYSCTQRTCSFQAHISAVLPKGTLSADTQLTKITISVRP
jgi:hypothetical protein